MNPHLKLIRPKHWLKNGFVLAPLVFSKTFTNPDALWHAGLAFAIFSAAASLVYVINDLADIEKDRLHPEKRLKRPLASGAVSVGAAKTIAALLAGGVAAGLYLLPAVGGPILAYLVLQVAYTYWLKHQPVLDLFAIAAGFVLRVVAGAYAIDVVLSHWMFITTLSLSLFLAAVKRRGELERTDGQARGVLAHYSQELMNRYAELGAICSIVFYSLYVLQEAPELALSIPFVLFGIFRYWFLAERSGGEDPTAELAGDPQMLLTVVGWVVFVGWQLLY